MKAVILAGGFGTRISEESQYKPKPMIEIGGKPIIWHIMKLYSFYGINEFIICAGYKQEAIKQYFANYALFNSDITFDFRRKGAAIIHSDVSEPWKVTVVDTGMGTMTGGRIRRIHNYVADEPFCLTYGDGVSDVNIGKEIAFHKKTKASLTITAVQPEVRFGFLNFADDGSTVTAFREKDKTDSGWINGGFMVVEPEVFTFLQDDSTVFEKEPLERCAKEGKLNAFKHDGFWQCMDTMREKEKLETLWASGKAPWKVW